MTSFCAHSDSREKPPNRPKKKKVNYFWDHFDKHEKPPNRPKKKKVNYFWDHFDKHEKPPIGTKKISYWSPGGSKKTPDWNKKIPSTLGEDTIFS